MVVYSLSQEYLKKNVLETRANMAIEENFSQYRHFISQEEKFFGTFATIPYLPRVFSFDGVYSLDYLGAGGGVIVKPTKKTSYQNAVKVRGENSEAVMNAGKDIDIVVEEAFSVASEDEARYMARFHFGVRNSIEFSYHCFLPPLAPVIDEKTKKQYKTIYCYQENETLYTYLAILWDEALPSEVKVFQGKRECQKTFASAVSLAGLSGVAGGVYQITRGWENGRYFGIWISDATETEFFTGGSRQVVGLLYEAGSISANVKRLEVAVYGSVFQGEYRKIHFLEAPAVVENVYFGNFAVVPEAVYRNISGGYTATHTVNVGTIDDTTVFDIFYQTLPGVWVKDGLTFFENGTPVNLATGAETNGLAGCYYYMNIGAGQLRVGAKASVVNSTMSYMILKWRLQEEPRYIFEGNIQSNPQLVFSLPRKPSFFIVRIGDETWWFEKEWGHFYNLTSASVTACFGALNEKRLVVEDGKWNLYVRMNNIYSFSSSTFRPTVYRALVW